MSQTHRRHLRTVLGLCVGERFLCYGVGNVHRETPAQSLGETETTAVLLSSTELPPNLPSAHSAN